MFNVVFFNNVGPKLNSSTCGILIAISPGNKMLKVHSKFETILIKMHSYYQMV